jgi:hypothetical protein
MLQGPNGKVKPIPEDEQFVQPPNAGLNSPIQICLNHSPPDDFALAVHLQEQEVMRAATQRNTSSHPDLERYRLNLQLLSFSHL